MTPEAIRALIKESFEPTEIRDKIRDYLVSREGKQFTKRDEKAMQTTIDPSIDVRKEHGWTRITWIDPGQTERGWGFIVARRTDAFPVPPMHEIEANNPGRFDASDERNRKRRELLANADALASLSEALEIYRTVRGTLEQATEYDGLFHVVACELRNAVRGKDDRGGW